MNVHTHLEVERGGISSFYKVGDIVIHYGFTGRKAVGVIHSIESHVVRVRFWDSVNHEVDPTPARVLPYRLVRIGWVE